MYKYCLLFKNIAFMFLSPIMTKEIYTLIQQFSCVKNIITCLTYAFLERITIC